MVVRGDWSEGCGGQRKRFLENNEEKGTSLDKYKNRGQNSQPLIWVQKLIVK